jgi:hypothetical protein
MDHMDLNNCANVTYLYLPPLPVCILLRSRLDEVR